MRKLINVGLILGAAGTALFVGATGAAGGSTTCQSFTVSAVPNPVQEGGSTTVSVSRIGTGSTSIDVDSINGTATAGSDFERVDRTIRFTTQTSQSFKVAIRADDDAEGNEQFRLHLSNVQGCGNQRFNIGPDEIVRIVDGQVQGSPPPTTRPTSAPTSRPSSTSTPETTTLETSPTPTVSPSPTPSPSPTLTPFPTATPEEDDDDGTPALAIAGILVAATAVLAAIALLLYVRRTRL
jgi:hypothetical protein